MTDIAAPTQDSASAPPEADALVIKDLELAYVVRGIPREVLPRGLVHHRCR